MKRDPVNARDAVGVLLPSSLTESFEIALARLADLSSKGTAAKVIACDGAVSGCVANPLGLTSTCRHCRQVRSLALSQIAPTLEVISLDEMHANSSINALPADVSKELTAGVHSTILTFYRRDIEPRPAQLIGRALYRLLAKRYYAHSAYVYAAIRHLLSTGVVGRLEFFNGRIVPTRGVLFAVRQVGADFGVLEVSGHQRHLTVANNSSVHDLDFKQAELKEFVDRSDLDVGLGNEFYESRRKGMETNDKSFTKDQRPGLLRQPGRPIVAIFTSSADELKVSGPQWFTQASEDPVSFIRTLAASISSEFHVVVRMHPNQDGDKTGAAQAMITALSASRDLELLLPRSRISTYELLDAAAAVVTFGSTIGVEATYWGKPSILAGRAVWDQLDVAYRADTPSEAATLLRANLEPKSKAAASAVGAYYLTGCGVPGALSWRHQGAIGFSVNGRSYLREKRSSPAYWVNRLVDRLLRKM